jgi:signal peptidase II
MVHQFSSKSRWWLWCLLALSLAAIDQTIKLAVSATLPLHTSIQITPWFNWTHVLNPGAAFSFFSDTSGWQRYFFSTVGLLVSTILLFSLWRGVTSRLVTAWYVSIIAGALGNVIDRVRLGAVVDYLDFHWGLWHWPAFNLADVLVVGGAIFLALSSFTFPRNEMKQAI